MTSLFPSNLGVAALALLASSGCARKAAETEAVAPPRTPAMVAATVIPPQAPIEVAPAAPPSQAPAAIAPTVTPPQVPVEGAPSAPPSPAPVAIAPTFAPSQAPVEAAPTVVPPQAPIAVAPTSVPQAESPQSLTAGDMQRLSPAAAVVAAFAAICGEPARRPVARAAAAREFTPVPTAVLREETPSAAFPSDGVWWRGPAEVGGAVLLWHPATATCEMRAQGVDPLVVDAEFAKLSPAFEAEGASVMRLQPPPARPGAPRIRQMLLVSPGGGPERARVLRLGDDGTAREALVMTARGVAATAAR